MTSPPHGETKNRVTDAYHRPFLTTSSRVPNSTTSRIFVVAMEKEEEEKKKDHDDVDNWVSLFPRRSRSSMLHALTSMPSFQAFVRGESSVFHSSQAFSSTLMEKKEDDHKEDNYDGWKMISAIQDDARLLKALGYGTSAGVVNNPDRVPTIRKGVTQLWLQVPSHSDDDDDDDESMEDNEPLTTRRSSSSSSSSSCCSLMTGNLDGRAHLLRLVEELRLALEDESDSTSSTTGPAVSTTRRRRRLPPDQVELSYLWYDGSSTTGSKSSTTGSGAGSGTGSGSGSGPQGAYYGRHIDTPWIPPPIPSISSRPRRRRVRCVSFLLYLGGDTDEPWNVKDHGGQLRIYMDPPLPTCGGPGGHVDVLPECGTLVLFDSATVPHEVLPTRRDRLAVVGWFGGTQEEI